MKTSIYFLFLLFHLFTAGIVSGQPDSILNQGIYRSFILHLPANYESTNKYPLVINLHGLNSNAAEQQFYSRFDAIADTAGCIVVYPNAVKGSWDLAGSKDVNFITSLVDTLQSRYSTNSCLFATGMSMGGFMSYKLGCSLYSRLTAIAVVAGNMPQLQQFNCPVSNGLPIMHFHGTADETVLYNGSAGIPSVPSTIAWWVNTNACNSTPVITQVPDINLADNSNVESSTYTNGKNNSEVVLYKIINGGHSWPGAIAIPGFGNTNQDINASKLTWDFFKRFCENLPEVFYWTGSISNVWENPLNWAAGRIPGPGSAVVIPTIATFFPSVSRSTLISSLEMKPGSTITLKPAVDLKLKSH
ncbi:MAG: PHB depolymerase family esterase [Bacteroidota bacterium]